MVAKGKYIVELVEAKGKAPFKEHQGDDGKRHAEVEPDVECCIKVQVLKGKEDKGLPVVTEHEVDGENLGYNLAWDNESFSYTGHWKHNEKDDTATDGPLRFERLAGPSATSGSCSDQMRLGSLCVNFFEEEKEGEETTSDTPSATEAPSGTGNVKKMVRSGKGSSSTNPHTQQDFRKGAFLDSITIHCGTVLGLIHAGVIGAWENARLQAPLQERSIDPVLANLRPKIVKVSAVTTEDGEVIKAATQYEVFDLTGIPHSDDEGEKEEPEKETGKQKGDATEGEKEEPEKATGKRKRDATDGISNLVEVVKFQFGLDDDVKVIGSACPSR